MDIRKIKKLIELVEESGISELEITEGEESVRINRYSPQPAQAPIQYSAAPQQGFLHRQHRKVLTARRLSQRKSQDISFAHQW